MVHYVAMFKDWRRKRLERKYHRLVRRLREVEERLWESPDDRALRQTRTNILRHMDRVRRQLAT
jgi:hypothetical protein